VDIGSQTRVALASTCFSTLQHRLQPFFKPTKAHASSGAPLPLLSVYHLSSAFASLWPCFYHGTALAIATSLFLPRATSYNNTSAASRRPFLSFPRPLRRSLQSGWLPHIFCHSDCCTLYTVNAAPVVSLSLIYGHK
jgi:hypothetical protein